MLPSTFRLFVLNAVTADYPQGTGRLVNTDGIPIAMEIGRVAAHADKRLRVTDPFR